MENIQCKPNFPQQNHFLSNFCDLDDKQIAQLHRQAKKQNSVSGLWSDEENLIYANFIQSHPFQFETAQKRRRFKVFERMAICLPNRTAIQCRSHNQKMVKLAGNIMVVPKYIKNKLSPRSQGAEDQPCLKAQRKLEEEVLDSQNHQKMSENNSIQKSHVGQTSFNKNEQAMLWSPFPFPVKLCIDINFENIADY